MTRLQLIPTIALAAVLGSGCATREYVHSYVAEQMQPLRADMKRDIDAVDARGQSTAAALRGLDGRFEASRAQTETQLAAQAGRLDAAEARITTLSQSASEAVARAEAAHQLAQGRLMYEVVLSDDTLKFPSGRAVLSASGKTALRAFAEDLKAQNHNVFIEIQGHTDGVGPEEANQRLGAARAEAVRHFLATQAGLPVHRLSAISYGESAPLASNASRDGRAKNRRVVLVVMQ